KSACIVLYFAKALTDLEQTACPRMLAKEPAMFGKDMRTLGHAPHAAAERSAIVRQKPHKGGQPFQPFTACFYMGGNLPASSSQFHHEGGLAEVQHLIVQSTRVIARQFSGR